MATSSQTLCYLGMGGNLGNPISLFDDVIDELLLNPLVATLRESPRYESEPIESSGPNYVNSVIEVVWLGDCDTLLKTCLSTEATHGRVRTVQNAPRLIDLDVLLFGDLMIDLPQLTIPHPRMHKRRFVLEPLIDLSPNIVIPGQGEAKPLLESTKNQWLQAIN